MVGITAGFLPALFADTAYYDCVTFRGDSELWSVRAITLCYFGGSGDKPVGR